MSYDVLIGYPDKRIIRLADLMPYFQAETNRSGARVGALSELPMPVQNVVRVLQETWADEPAVDMEARASGKVADYRLGSNSVFVSFPDAQEQAANDVLIKLAIDHEVFLVDASRGAWLEARRPEGRHTPATGSTGEFCMIKYVAFDDVDTLIAPGVFTNGQFLSVIASQSQFLQVIAFGTDFIAEFKSGPERLLYRTRFSGISKAHALFKGYLEGKEMNNDTYRFGVAYNVAGPFLPPRDEHGMWRVQDRRPLAGRVSMSSSLSQ